MFGQSVPWPGGQSSGDSGETGGVPVSHTAAPRWVTTGPPTSNMKGAGGRGTGVQLEGPVGPGRGQAERRRYSGDRDSPLGRNTHCYGEGSCHLLWTRDCRPPGLARGANGAPEERPPPKAGPAWQHPVVLAPRLLCQRGLRGWLGLGPAGWPVLPLQTSGPQVQPPTAKPSCVPHPQGWEGPEKCV